MSEKTEPPSYEASSAEPPSYPRLLPAKFKVGCRETAPLVTVEELEAHLRTLGAFSRLKARVEQSSQQAPSSLQNDAVGAWTVFLCRAVHRFERWIKTVHALPEERSLPPLDVLMVWHAYMLVRVLAMIQRILNVLAESTYLRRRREPTAPSAEDALQISTCGGRKGH